MAAKNTRKEFAGQDVPAQDVGPQDVAADVMPHDEPAVEIDVYAAEMPPLTPTGGYTVSGKAIPEHLAHLVPFASTDQGRWEACVGKERPTGPRVSVVRDAWDSMIEERRDQPWAASDPLKEAVARYGERGMRNRALSPAVIEQRGMRGWEPVVKENGDPVKIGNLILARMPERVAEQRNKHYRDLGNEQLRSAEENLTIDQERAIRDAGAKGRGISPLRPGSSLTDSRNPERGAVVGVESVRGRAE